MQSRLLWLIQHLQLEQKKKLTETPEQMDEYVKCTGLQFSYSPKIFKNALNVSVLTDEER